MSIEVTVAFPDEIYRRLERRAFSTGQDVAGILIEVVNRDQTLLDAESADESDNDAERDPYRFAGMWSDMTEEEERLFAEIIAERKNYFPRPLLDFFDQEES